MKACYTKLTDEQLDEAIDAAFAEYYRLATRPRTNPSRSDLAPLDRATKTLEALQAENCRRLGIDY